MHGLFSLSVLQFASSYTFSHVLSTQVLPLPTVQVFKKVLHNVWVLFAAGEFVQVLVKHFPASQKQVLPSLSVLQAISKLIASHVVLGLHPPPS